MGNSNLWRSDCSNQRSLRATIWITNPELAWWYHAREVSYIAERWTRAPEDNRTIPGGDELGGRFLQTIILGFCGEVWETRYHLSGTSGGCAFHILDMVSSVIITLQVSLHIMLVSMYLANFPSHNAQQEYLSNTASQQVNNPNSITRLINPPTHNPAILSIRPSQPTY